MANNEGVNIIIKATDQYTATINKINASNELLGKTIKSVQQELNATTKLWTTLRVQGFDPASASMKVLKMNAEQLNFTLNSMKTAATGASGAITSSAANLKKSNQQWTNLALVVQDLPFGFRGIQNNLPALMGSVAGAAGPAYLAFSALIAAVTAYDLGLFGATKKTNDFAKSLKEVNSEIKSTINYTNSEVSNLMGLIDVMTDVNSSESLRKKSLEELREIIKEVDETESKKMTTEGAAIGIVYKYIEAIKQKQMQEVLGKRIAEIEIGQIERRNTLAIETAKAQRGFHPIDLFMGNTALQGLQTEIIANETLLRQLEDYRKTNTKALLLNPFSSYNAKGPNNNAANDANAAIEQQQRVNEQVIQNLIDSKKKELALYEDDAYKKYDVAKELAQLEVRLNLEKLKNSKYTATQKAALEKGVYQEYANQLILIDKDMQEQILINSKKVSDKKKKDKEKELAEEAKYTKNYIKSLNTQLAVELKLHKGNLNLQQEDIKSKINQLKFAQVFAAGNVKATEQINAALLQLNATLTGVGTNWSNTANKITSITNDFLINSFTSLGESIGKALGGEKVQPFVALAEILASALIDLGKALISFAILEGLALQSLKDPTKWPLALAAGTAAVIAGSFLKAKLGKDKTQKFANGGIVSGPTYGLMGEYPGAASNPEVVAPLDKLKDMIGGGNGTLEARISGNDLVILMNKASRNNNNTF